MVFTKVKDQKAICISASNIIKNQKHSTSYLISEIIGEVLAKKEVFCEILDLRKFGLMECTGCDGCEKERKCVSDEEFNRICEKLARANYIFVISPHCAPIPAKLSMLLEKMGNSFSKPGGILAGIISYGEGKYQDKIVNDIISDILEKMQIKVIPYNSKWDTGICLPIDHEGMIQEPGYDKVMLETEIEQYVKVVLQTAKSLHAIM